MMNKWIAIKTIHSWKEGEIYDISEPYIYPKDIDGKSLIVVDAIQNGKSILYNARILNEGYLMSLAIWRENQIDSILTD